MSSTESLQSSPDQDQGADLRPWSEHAFWLPALLCLAGVLRLVSWSRTASMFNDGPVFLRMAEDFLAGRWSELLSHAYHPLYPLAAAGLAKLSGDLESAAVAVSIASGMAAVAFLFMFVRSAFGVTPAYIAAALLAVHPYAVRYSSDVQCDSLYLALLLGGVAALWQALQRHQLRFAWLAGACAGLAYLTRPEGLGIVLVGLFCIGLAMLRRGLPWRRAFALSAPMVLGALLFVAPYSTAISLHAGELRVTQKKHVAEVVGLVDSAREIRRAERLAESKRRVAEATSERAAARAKRLANRRPTPWQDRADALKDFLSDSVEALRPDHLVLLLLGVWVCRGRPGMRGEFVLSLVGLYALVLIGLRLATGYLSKRHTLPPLTVTFGYLALGVPVLGRGLLSGLAALARSARKPQPRTAWIVGLALIATISAGKTLKPHRSERAATRAAAEWLAGQPFPVEVVAVRKERDAYYAGAVSYPLPKPSKRRPLLSTLEASGVRYLVLDDRDWERYPELDRTGADRLRLLHRVEEGGRWAGVFEIASASPPAVASGPPGSDGEAD